MTEAQECIHMGMSTCHEHNLSIIPPWMQTWNRLRIVNPQTVARLDSYANNLASTTWQKHFAIKQDQDD